MEYGKATNKTMKLVAEIANKHHLHLGGVKIAVIMREKASKRNGTVTLATASLPSKKVKPLLDDNYSFVIVIAADEWSVASMEKKMALVDHELCHCGFNTDGNPYIKPHDYEEFAQIIERHGFWRSDRGEGAVQEVLGNQKIEVGTLSKAAARSRT